MKPKKRARLEKKLRETHREELLERAKMSIYDLNTGVIRSTDSTRALKRKDALDHRIMITSAFDRDWSDTIGIGAFDPSVGGWRVGHYSVARARLLAHLILERCARMEADVNVSSFEYIDEKAQPNG